MGDIFLESCIQEYSIFGNLFLYVEDTPDYFLVEKIPASVILGGHVY